MLLIKLNTVAAFVVFDTLSGGAVTHTGYSVAKAGGGFSAGAGTFASSGNGFYTITPYFAEADTLGALCFQLTDGGGNYFGFTCQVVVDLPGATVSGVTGDVAGSVGGNVAGNVGGNVAGNVGSVAGDVAGKVLGGGASSFSGDGVQASSVTGNVAGSVGSVAGNVVGNVLGDVAGKVLGSGGSAITGDGVRAASVTGNVGGSVSGDVAGNVVGNVSGDVAGKVLGGGAGVISAVGVSADVNAIVSSGTAANNLGRLYAVCPTAGTDAGCTTTTIVTTLATDRDVFTGQLLVWNDGGLYSGTYWPITGYAFTGGFVVLTLDPAMPFTPAAGRTFLVIGRAPGAGGGGGATAAQVWAYGTRVLTAGTNIVLAKGTGVTGFNDIAASAVVSGGAITTSGGAVSAVTTLTNLPAVPTDWLTAAGVKADAVTKIQAGLSTYAGGDTSGTTTLLTRLTSARGGYLDNLSAGAAALASTALSTAQWTNARAGYLDNLATAPPTAAAVATAVWTDATASDFTTAGTPGKVLKAQLGGAFTTPTSSVFSTAALANAGGGTDPLTNPVPGDYAAGTAGAALGRVGARQIVVASTVMESGDVRIVRGDDYYLVDGRDVFHGATFTAFDLTGATVTFYCRSLVGTFSKVCTVTLPGEASQGLLLELSHAETLTLATGAYHVEAVLADTHQVRLTEGNLGVPS